ncbi:golgin subfamily A member 4 isoform X2 [Cololabis saira]|nr:golgin subfamily A member 4 isoform X2 [Cololabis saira]
MNQLLEVYDGEAFQILKLMALTREVSALQKMVERGPSSTETRTEFRILQRNLQEKTAELNAKTQELKRNQPNSALILQIISLQSQIWDLQQAGSRQETALQTERKIQDLQEQLDSKIRELQGKGDTITTVLEVISVRSKITIVQKTIRYYTEKSRTNAAEIERQWRKTIELLKQKILQLNDDENNKELTKEILELQGEVMRLTGLRMTAQETLEIKLKEVREDLEVTKKREQFLQKQLQDADYALAQQIMKIIMIMEELREQSQLTSTGQTRDVLTQLQAYKQDYAKAQTEITDLQQKLRQLQEACSGPEGKYNSVKVELEQKIAELNQTEDSSAALILSLINLHGELKALKKQISTTDDADMISKLQKQLQEKQKHLDSKAADISRLTASPQLILKIIELQNDIRDLHNNDSNDNAEEISELQNRVNGLLTELDDRSPDSTKLIIQILTLQSQVEYLRRQLSKSEVAPNTSVTELKNELASKEKELQQHVSELKEKNQTNANLILSITDLEHQLRKIEREKQTEDKAASATISKLRKELSLKEKEHDRDQALIKALQNSVNETEVQCSAHEQKITALQNELDTKLEELKSKSDTVTSLALQVSTLSGQLAELKQQLQDSPPKSKLEELQRIIDEKSRELDTKKDALKERSSQAQRLLQIILLQVEIAKLGNEAVNDTDFANIAALQDHLTYLIDGIKDSKNETTKLTFQILSQQDEIFRLKKQQDSQLKEQAKRIKDLEDEQEYIRSQIQEKTRLLNMRDVRIANLSADIMELHKKIQPLTDEVSDLKETYDGNLAELQERLNLTKSQLQDCELQLQHADAKNFKLTMTITNLRMELKKAKKEASRNPKKNIADLEQQLETQKSQNRNLESTNKGLEQQVRELDMCCTVNNQCEDVQKKLQQSQEDADSLLLQLQEKDAALKKSQQDFERLGRDKAKLQENYNNLLKKQGDVDDRMIFPSSITLDPDTAHPRLVLGEGNTAVSTTNNVQNVQDLPGRYDVSLAVLGTTGYSSGRHYWEVSVAGKICYHLGMTSESARRKGSLSFKPANGFWTIVLDKQGQLKAIDRKAVVLASQTQPLSLGVLLDYSKGSISFYDAGDRTHMYTFSGQTFTDKMYPFINYCVEDVQNPSPIVLVPPGSTDWIQ